MNTQLQEFSFEDKKITTVIYADKPAFVAMDVARALGYLRPADALKQHCKSLIKIKYGEMQCLGFDPKPQGVTLIHEPDVFRLIVHSKLESAERFQDWVFEEVLPTIRATGGYSLKTPAEEFDDVIQKQKELLEKGDFQGAMSLAASTAKDSQEMGSRAGKSLAERKRQKKIVKQAIKEIADTVQLEFKDF